MLGPYNYVCIPAIIILKTMFRTYCLLLVALVCQCPMFAESVAAGMLPRKVLFYALKFIVLLMIREMQTSTGPLQT